MGTGAQGTGTNAITLATTIAVSDKLSFVFDTGFQCLLPASMEWWQADALALHSSQQCIQTILALML